MSAKKTTKKVTKKVAKKATKKVAKKVSKKVAKKVSKKKTTMKKVVKATPRPQVTAVSLSTINASLHVLTESIHSLLKWAQVQGPSGPVDVSSEVADTSLGLETQTDNSEQQNLFDTSFTDTGSEVGPVSISKEDVTQALQNLSASHGLENVKEILNKYKAKRVSDIKEKDYEAVVSDCNPVS